MTVIFYLFLKKQHISDGTLVLPVEDTNVFLIILLVQLLIKQYVLFCFRNYWVRIFLGQKVQIQIDDHHNLFECQKQDIVLNETLREKKKKKKKANI